MRIQYLNHEKPENTRSLLDKQRLCELLIDNGYENECELTADEYQRQHFCANIINFGDFSEHPGASDYKWQLSLSRVSNLYFAI